MEFLGISPDTRAEALSEATYFACLKILSEGLGKLPLKIQRSQPQSGVATLYEHRYYRTLNERPNEYMTATTFWGMMQLYRDHYGNAYALIDESKPQHPQLWPMHPNDVEIYYDDAKLLRDVPDVYYRYTAGAGNPVFSSAQVLHFKSFLTFDGIIGKSVREQLKDTIAGGGKSQKMLNGMYDSGMTAKAVLQYTGGLNDANVKALREGIQQYASGEDGSGAAGIIPIPVGFTLTPLNMKLADSQFLELKQCTAMQIAAAFGVKPYQIGDYTKSSYASAESQQISFLVDTMLFIIKQYEEELNEKLFTGDERQNGMSAKFNTRVMLRADQLTQINTLSTAVSNFLYTPNEARSFLDMPALAGGDRLLGNGASIPVELTGRQYVKEEENG